MQSPLPNTSIFIDSFARVAGVAGVYFLTHAHTDHTRGLSRGWRNGLLYCSKISADILVYRGIVSPSVLRVRHLEQPFEITDQKHPGTPVTATFLDANHCPGAIMVALEWPSGSAVVCTCDFRYTEAMWASPTLRRIVDSKSCAALHYDASWAHEALCNFPEKGDSVGMLLDLIERFPADQRVIMHSHCMGDEDLLGAIADHFPDETLLFADKGRLDELKICDFAYLSRCELLPANGPCPARHRFIIVSNASQRRMDKRLDGVDAIEVSCSTLWWAKNFRRLDLDCYNPVRDEATGIWHVLFAMHSSDAEIQLFCARLSPQRLHPICETILEVAARDSQAALLEVTTSTSAAASTSSSSRAMASDVAAAASEPSPPDTLAMLHDSQWDMLASHVGVPSLARSLKRRRTATTEIDRDSSCSDTLPDDFDETPLLQ